MTKQAVSFTVRSDSDIIVSGTELVRAFEDIIAGARVMRLQIDTEDITVVQIEGLQGLDLMRDNSGNLDEGIRFAGSLIIDFAELYKIYPNLLDTGFGKTRGLFKIILNQSTGSNVNYTFTMQYVIEAL